MVQMLRLHPSFYFNSNPFFSASLSLKINQKTSILWIGWNCCKVFLKRRKNSSFVVGAVERESEFEVDPVKAREALRKLDEQLQSLAPKKVNPPKLRDLSSTRDEKKQGVGYVMEIPGTLLTNVAAVLIIFTIFYNVLFLTVIKPAIDGPETIEATSSMNKAEKVAPPEPFSSTRSRNFS